MKLPTAGLLVVRDRKLLLAFSRNKQCFYLPGGKVEGNETAASALCREIAEEMNLHLQESDLSYYTHITAHAYGEDEGVVMEQDCFFVRGEVSPQPGAEIGELRYFTLAEYLLQERRAPGAILILQKLNEEDLID